MCNQSKPKREEEPTTLVVLKVIKQKQDMCCTESTSQQMSNSILGIYYTFPLKLSVDLSRQPSFQGKLEHLHDGESPNNSTSPLLSPKWSAVKHQDLSFSCKILRLAVWGIRENNWYIPFGVGFLEKNHFMTIIFIKPHKKQRCEQLWVPRFMG